MLMETYFCNLWQIGWQNFCRVAKWVAKLLQNATPMSLRQRTLLNDMTQYLSSSHSFFAWVAKVAFSHTSLARKKLFILGVTGKMNSDSSVSMNAEKNATFATHGENPQQDKTMGNDIKRCSSLSLDIRWRFI